MNFLIFVIVYTDTADIRHQFFDFAKEGISMIRKEKKYTACPKCLGNMKVRKDGSYKCRLCKSVYTHEEYIASVSKMLLSDINRWNESESKMADVRKLNMLLDKWNKQFE